jgi:hypothetical protein
MKKIIIFVLIVIFNGFSFSNSLILNSESSVSNTQYRSNSPACIIAAEFIGSLIGGVTGIALGCGIVILSGGKIELHEAVVIRPKLAFSLGSTIGYSTGCAVGAYLSGNASKQEGRLLPSLIGTLAGVPVAFGLAFAASKLEEKGDGGILLLIPALAAPPIGAVIGYNLSRPNLSKAQTFYQHFDPPTLRFRLEKTKENRAITCLDFELINARY